MHMENIKKIYSFIEKNIFTIITILLGLYIFINIKNQSLQNYRYILLLLEIYNIINIFYHKKFKIFNFDLKLYIIFVIGIIIIGRININPNYYENYYNIDGNDITSAILTEKITQKISSKIEYINIISIQTATYARKNTANYKFLLFENNNIIRESIINSNEFIDGGFYDIKFKKIKLEKNNNYYFEIVPIYATGDNCISLYYNKNNNTINYKISYVKNINYKKIYMLITLLVMYVILNIIIYKYKVKVDKYYILLFFVIGLYVNINILIKGISATLIFLFVVELYNLLKAFNCKFLNKKIFNILPKNKIIYLIFTIFLFNMINTYVECGYKTIYAESEGNNITEPIISKQIEQKINTENITYFDSISIQVGTYKRVNQANYRFEIYENGRKIFSKNINAQNMEDGEYYKIIFSRIKVKENKEYTFKITPINASSSNCISLFYNSETNNLNYLILKNNINNIFKIIILTIFLIIYLILNYIINTKKISTEKAYILFSIYIFSFIFIMPSLNAPDEYLHFLRSYKLSEVAENYKNKDFILNGELSSPNIDCLTYGNPQKTIGVVNFNKMLVCLKKNNNKMNNGDQYKSLRNVNPIVHIVQGIGIKIADIFSNAPLIIFWGGRISNCLLAFLIIYYSIKKVKSNKILLLLIATLPMFVQQMASYSYDCLINAFAIFILCLSINKIDNEKITKKDNILLFFAIIYIYLAKLIYLWILIPLLFINNSHKENKLKDIIKNISKILIMLAICFVISKIWLYFYNYNIDGISNGITSMTNFKYIINNPLKLISIIKNTIKYNGWFYIKSLFGYFSWFTYSFEDYIYVVFIIMYFIIINSSKELEKKFNKKQIIVSLFVILVIIAAIFGAMYITWSTDKLNYVDGVQGRYFLPIIGLFTLTILPKFKLKINLEEKDYLVYINSTLLLTLIISIIYIY